MTVRVNPMSTQRGIQLSEPSELYPRAEACGGAERSLPSVYLGTAIVAGCVATEQWLRQLTLGEYQDNGA